MSTAPFPIPLADTRTKRKRKSEDANSFRQRILPQLSFIVMFMSPLKRPLSAGKRFGWQGKAAAN